MSVKALLEHVYSEAVQGPSNTCLCGGAQPYCAEGCSLTAWSGTSLLHAQSGTPVPHVRSGTALTRGGLDLFICDIKYDLKLHMLRVSSLAHAASYSDKNNSIEHFLMRSVCPVWC